MKGESRGGGRHEFPATPSEMMVYSGQLKNKSHTTHSSHQPHSVIIRTGFLQNPNYILLSEKLAMAEIRGYTNSHWRIWETLGHLSSSFYLGPIVDKNQQNVICKNHEKRNCRGKERHMEGKEEVHPRPKAQRRGKARVDPHLLG